MKETSLRILLVEDDPRNVELFQATLEDDGHDVTVERDGLSGQARALAERFDLILLDIQLPQRSGLAVCRALRASGVRTPIVALSASVLPDEVTGTQGAGFDLFVPKPVAPAALRATVRSIAEARAR